MVRSLIETERCRGVKKRVYLPDVDEYRSSSRPLSGKPVGSPQIRRGDERESVISVSTCTRV